MKCCDRFTRLSQGWKCSRTFQALKWLNYTNILLLIHDIIGTLSSINNQTEIFPVGFVVVNELILLIFIRK